MRTSTFVRTGVPGWLALALALGGCTAQDRQAMPVPVAPRHATAPPACPVTAVRTGPVPSVVPGFSTTLGPATPWMGDARFTAVLFYANGADPTMRALGRMRTGTSTKIFWWVAGGGDVMTVRGEELASGRTFRQVMTGIGGGQFPSVPVVPSAGCWTLTESIDGRDVGAITIPVTGPVRP